MTKEERNKIIARAMQVPAELLAEKVVVSAASVLGRLIVSHNRKRLKTLQVERMIRRLNIWEN